MGSVSVWGIGPSDPAVESLRALHGAALLVCLGNRPGLRSLVFLALGFIVGTAIAGQTFYNFTLDNLRHFGALKAMGASDGMLLKMILLQAAMVGMIGYGLGVGAAG